MRLLELFSGTQSIGKVARELGIEVTSVDIDGRHRPDLLLDIAALDETRWPKDHFQFIWASPPCESYSTCRSNAKVDRMIAMQEADKLLAKTRQIIEYFSEGGCHWAIENPLHSHMWTRQVADGLIERSCVTSYCSFGANYRKNTRIANSFGLELPKCQGAGHCPAMLGSMHKERAQRGGGGVFNKYHTLDELHSIPSELCRSVLAQVKKMISLS